MACPFFSQQARSLIVRVSPNEERILYSESAKVSNLEQWGSWGSISFKSNVFDIKRWVDWKVAKLVRNQVGV